MSEDTIFRRTNSKTLTIGLLVNGGPCPTSVFTIESSLLGRTFTCAVALMPTPQQSLSAIVPPELSLAHHTPR